MEASDSVPKLIPSNEDACCICGAKHRSLKRKALATGLLSIRVEEVLSLSILPPTVSQTTSGHSMLSSVQARAPPSRPEENTAEAMESYEEAMTKYLTGEVTPGQMLYVVDLVQKQVAKITTKQSTFEGLTANMYPEDPKA
eukprot:gene16292-biopygen25259